MFVTFIVMIGMAAIAKPMILVLIGEKWMNSIQYLQLLCFVGVLYPLHAMNLNLLKVFGRSDLFLKLEIIKKILSIPIILIGIFFGIKYMILAMIFNGVISLYLNSYWSKKLIDYSFLQQIKDITPSFILAICMGLVVFFSNYFINQNNLLALIFFISLGFITVVILCELMKIKEYQFFKKYIFKFITKNNE